MITFDERPESRSVNSYAKGEHVREYQLLATAGEAPDEQSAVAIAAANVPIFAGYAWLQDIVVKPVGPGFWYITAPYGPLPKLPGSIQIRSRTTGGTVHIVSSREMVAKYGTGAPDTTVIGQDGAGAEITVPVQMRSYTYNFPRGVVTEALMDYWEDLTGIVNSATWHNRPAGEVLFLGTDSQTTISADSNSSVTFEFAMSRNQSGLTIGAITGVAKQGHDLIDIHTKTAVVSGQNVQQEKFIYIQRVYERKNFTTYLGF